MYFVLSSLILVIEVVTLHLHPHEIITFAPSPGFLSNSKIFDFKFPPTPSLTRGEFSSIVAAAMSHAAHHPMIAMVIPVVA
jgi:hypothetical protein